MGFLHFLDVAIGFALGMAVLATLIGTFSGVWLALIRTRTRQVRTGLASLVANLGTITGTESQAVADSLLSDHMVKARTIRDQLEDPAGWRGWPGAFIRFIRGFSAETIHREELALLLLRRASEGHALAAKAAGLTADAAGEVLRKVEKAILDQEALNPDLPAQIWRVRALSQHAGEMASRLFSQFDNVMDRVEDNVSFSAKAVAVFFAALFLSHYPVDSLEMIQRLSTDAELRSYLVEEAKNAPASQLVADKVKASRLFGSTFDKDRPWQLEDARNLGNTGVLLTWIMVSLGAPFWLSLLDKLLGLRSEVARKATEQRTVREAAQPTPSPS